MKSETMAAKASSAANGKTRLSSIERVFGILEHLAVAGSMTRKEISEAALSRRDNIPKATLSDLMSMLTRLGYLRYRQDIKTYSLGVRLIDLGVKRGAGQRCSFIRFGNQHERNPCEERLRLESAFRILFPDSVALEYRSAVVIISRRH